VIYVINNLAKLGRFTSHLVQCYHQNSSTAELFHSNIAMPNDSNM